MRNTTVDVCLEGGGTKGIAYVGALQALEQNEVRVRCSVGTSAGAITALLLQLGYSSAQMHELLTEKIDGEPRFTSFFDVPSEFSKQVLHDSLLMQEFRAIDIPLVPESVEARIDRAIMGALLKGKYFRQFFSLVERGGLFAGERFVEWLEWLLQRRGFAKDLTLTELPQLTVIAADITSQEKLVLNGKTAPHMPVVWAVRASMSIPLVWQSVLWQEAWGNYAGRALHGHELVDGGLCSNFPLRLLLEPSELMAETESLPVLGLLLDEELRVEGIPSEHRPLPKPLDHIEALVDTMRQGNDRAVLQRYEDNVCRLPCSGYGTLEELAKAKEAALIKAARRAVRAHLLTRN